MPQSIRQKGIMNNSNLTRFGFSFEKGGAHLARTMMLKDLTSLIDYVDNQNAPRNEYIKAIIDENCLGKKSGQTRKISLRHLKDLYILDPNVVLFKALLFLWNRDPVSRHLLALLCTIARDAMFRKSVPFMRTYSSGQRVDKKVLEKCINKNEPGRFSKSTLESLVRNINATWTQSGHLTGRVKKYRSLVEPSAGAVSYALLLGYLSGVRGEALFCTDYAKILDCPGKMLVMHAEEASRKGWIVFKRVGDVIEVLFPNLLTSNEMEWVHEQN